MAPETLLLDPGGQVTAIDPKVTSRVPVVRHAMLKPILEGANRYAQLLLQLGGLVEHGQHAGRFHDNHVRQTGAVATTRAHFQTDLTIFHILAPKSVCSR